MQGSLLMLMTFSIRKKLLVLAGSQLDEERQRCFVGHVPHVASLPMAFPVRASENGNGIKGRIADEQLHANQM